MNISLNKLNVIVVYFYVANIIQFIRKKGLVKESFIELDLELDELLKFEANTENKQMAVIPVSDIEKANTQFAKATEDINILKPGRYTLHNLDGIDVELKIIEPVSALNIAFEVIQKPTKELNSKKLYMTVYSNKIVIADAINVSENSDLVLVLKSKKDDSFVKLYNLVKKIMLKLGLAPLTLITTILSIVFSPILKLINRLRGNRTKALALTKENYIVLENKIKTILSNVTQKIKGATKTIVNVIWKFFVGIFSFNKRLISEALSSLANTRIGNGLLKVISKFDYTKKYKEKINELTAELQKAQTLVVYMGEHINTLMKANKELTEQIEQLKKQVEKRRKSVLYLRSVLKQKRNLESINEALKQELEQSKQNIAELKEALAQNTKLLKELEEKYKYERNLRTATAQSYEEGIKKLRSLIKDLEYQIEVERHNRDIIVDVLKERHDNEKQELSNKIKALEEVISNKEKENNNLKQQIKNLEESKQLWQNLARKGLININVKETGSKVTITLHDARRLIETDKKYKPFSVLLGKLQIDAKTNEEKQLINKLENALTELVYLEKQVGEISYVNNILRSLAERLDVIKKKEDLFNLAKGLLESITKTIPKIKATHNIG